MQAGLETRDREKCCRPPPAAARRSAAHRSCAEVSRIKARSTRLLVGLAGVSTIIRQTRPPPSAARFDARSAASATAVLSWPRVKLSAFTPNAGSVFSMRVSVPPYKGWLIRMTSPGAHVRPEDRGNCRHAAGEHRRRLALLPQRQTVLEHFEVGVVETRIHEAGGLTGLGLAPARGEVEEILAVLRRFEDESRCQEDRRLQRSFRKTRVIAVAHHLGFGFEHVFADFALMIRLVTHASPNRSIL